LDVEVEGSKQPSGKDLPLRQHQNKGMFHQSHNFPATGNFIDGNVGSGEKYPHRI
jgi:hypothetical protein